MGVSSISQVGDFYVQNARHLDHYYTSLEREEIPIHRGYRMTDEDRLRRKVIMELICNLHIDTNECPAPDGTGFWEHFSAESRRLCDMERDGLLEIDTGSIRVTERGRPYLRNICMVFDQYLTPPGEAANAPRYSAVL
jgi:oxygen-independent coproporphyrinogen-3 oxidase